MQCGNCGSLFPREGFAKESADLPVLKTHRRFFSWMEYLDRYRRCTDS